MKKIPYLNNSINNLLYDNPFSLRVNSFAYVNLIDDLCCLDEDVEALIIILYK